MGDPFDYRDPELYGKLDDVIESLSFNYYVYVKTPMGINPEGVEIYKRRKYLIRGSLQTWKKRHTYGSEDNPNNSKRDGRFYSKYNVKLNEGDIIQKNDNYFKVIDHDDFDYGGVRQYSVERVGYDEIVRYNFEDYVEERFENMPQVGLDS